MAQKERAGKKYHTKAILAFLFWRESSFDKIAVFKKAIMLVSEI